MAEKVSLSSLAMRKRARPTAEVNKMVPLWDCGGLNYLGYRLVLAARLFERRVTLYLAEHTSLTLPEWRVLAQLSVTPTGTVRSLSDGAAVDRAEVSRATRRLTERGLLRRLENAADLRSPKFELTEFGAAEVDRIRVPIVESVTQMFAGIDHEDLEATDRVLWAVTRACIPAADGDGAHAEPVNAAKLPKLDGHGLLGHESA